MGVAPGPKGASRNQRVGPGRKKNLSGRAESKKELPNARPRSLSTKLNCCNAGSFQGYFITDDLSCLQISHKQAAFWTLGLLGMSERTSWVRHWWTETNFSWGEASAASLGPQFSCLLTVSSKYPGRILILWECFTFRLNHGEPVALPVRTNKHSP